MQIYIFRILSEEEDTFIREIALSEDNTLFDFHTILTESIGVSSKLLASFYLTSRQWEKQKEFTLLDMEPEVEASNRHVEESIPIGVMNSAFIGDIIEDQKQRMIYEYNFLNPLLFFISLIEVKEAKANAKYPQVVFSEGVLDSELLQKQDAFFDDQENYFDSFDDFLEEDDTLDELSSFGFGSDDEDFGENYDDNDDY